MKRKGIIVFIFALVLVFILTVPIIRLYTDWLWFDNLEFGSVFFTVLASQWVLRIVAFVISALFIFFNLLILKKDLLKGLNNLRLKEENAVLIMNKIISGKKLSAMIAGISVLISLFLTSYVGELWLQVRQYFQGVDYGAVDPIFNKDISFYLFQLPFLNLLVNFSIMLLAVTVVLTGIAYFIINPPVQKGNRFILFPYKGLGHISLLFFIGFLIKAYDYRLQMYELLFSENGFVSGAGFTDINATLPALWILLVLTILFAVIMLVNMIKKKSMIFIITIAIVIGASILIRGIYPSLIQNFRVAPNELNFEKQYIEHNIKYTLMGFGLDKVKTEEYPVRDELVWSDLEKAEGTIENVRLWDYRPLNLTFNQLQGIRPYYQFKDVDTDRYFFNGSYRQVMLSSRELNQNNLSQQAKTWVNLHLQYTHGYGLTMSSVAEVGEKGLPLFDIKDIPTTTKPGLKIERPEIYYGEISSDYVIVNSKTPEFSYPDNNQNKYIHYDGEGGVLLNGLPRRLMYALIFGDINIAISSELTNESRIMYNRRVVDRIKRIAPFLTYDDDPYIVLADEKLYWIIDAYTTSDMFPYSEDFWGINYMRNSVKIVIDAYNGDVDFYIADSQDPVIRTYDNIFPDLFKPIDEMPEQLFDHIRYPETLLNVQSRVYATYHMTDPVVFYNKEDMWEIPNEKYDANAQPMEPYYTIFQLPGNSEPEFVLMQPFTPAHKDNMVSWMAGRSDKEHYGELILYSFPRGKLIYGPMQIETRVDQNTLISQQLSLWDQRGSRVIRGNLLVLPVEGSILYVEPIYLQAEDSELPELVRVIVGFGETVVMEETLDQALISVFGEKEKPDEPEPDEPEPDEPEPGEEPVVISSDVIELSQRIQELYEDANEKLMNGDWAGYGETMKELEENINQLHDVVNE